MSKYEINWSDIAFGSKKPLKDLKAVFILAPREITQKRFTQLIKQYLPIGNIVVGFAEEDYINGFENQPQFKTLKYSVVRDIIDKVNNSASPNKITSLHYNQSGVLHILDKIPFKSVILINGSWQHSFHLRSEYYALVSKKIPFELVSPFVDEDEALEYAKKFKTKLQIKDKSLTDIEMMRLANDTAKNSFDTSHQTGALIGKKASNGNYKPLLRSFNKVVPFQTFAWHFGASRERNMSQPGDLNHYDAIHAENLLIIDAGKQKIDLKGTSLFINLLPCPTCARMLCETDIAEVVYSLDHSEGYAVALLEKAGKKVRRLIDNEKIITQEV